MGGCVGEWMVGWMDGISSLHSLRLSLLWVMSETTSVPKQAVYGHKHSKASKKQYLSQVSMAESKHFLNFWCFLC